MPSRRPSPDSGAAPRRLTMGELARRAGVNRETVRYYERRRLLPRAARSMNGYRIFSDDAIDRLRFIRHAQALGFTLNEIRELLGLRIDAKGSCEAVRVRATRKLRAVEAKIAALKQIRAVLGNLVGACATRRPTDACPILEGLRSADSTGDRRRIARDSHGRT